MRDVANTLLYDQMVYARTVDVETPFELGV